MKRSRMLCKETFSSIENDESIFSTKQQCLSKKDKYELLIFQYHALLMFTAIVSIQSCIFYFCQPLNQPILWGTNERNWNWWNCTQVM